MTDITMSIDDTLELDTIIENSSRATNPLSDIDSSFEKSGIQTHSTILNPTKPGDYTIKVNGQELSIKVKDSNIIPDSGILRYEFEQSVKDSWNNYDGTDNTSAGYVSDSAIGTYSKNFDGNDDYIELSTHSNSGAWSDLSNGSFSISIYFKLEENKSGWIWEKRDISTRGPRTFSIRSNNGNIEQQFAGEMSASLDVDDNKWHQVVLTHNGSSYWTMYLDGSPVSSTTNNNNFGGGNSITIGARKSDDGSVGAYWPGQLDDARAYNKELSPSEVSDLYNNGYI